MTTAPKQFKYYDLVMAAFVTVYICSNLIGPAKAATLFGYTFGAGVLFFPISYIFGDILTEVYGYARARKVSGPASARWRSRRSWPGWWSACRRRRTGRTRPVYEMVFGQTPRIVGASLIAYFCGEFVNSFMLAKMKILTKGKWLWTRTIGSTIVGEAVDSALFYPLAFYGIFSDDLLVTVMVTNYFLKIGWEVVMTPVTYKVVAFLKRASTRTTTTATRTSRRSRSRPRSTPFALPAAARRRKSFSPDHVASIAHTFTSTMPSGNATSRTVSSVTSVATPDAFFGHATQIIPPWASFGSARCQRRRECRARRDEQDRDVEFGEARETRHACRARPREACGKSAGASATYRRCPAFIPSFCHSGLPE